MYLLFFGLQKKPFQINTNPSFFWLGEKQKEVLKIFKYGLSKMPGLLLLTGDAGTGKTTLINVFLNSLGNQYLVVKIPDPDLEDIDFLNYIADVLDFKTKFSSKESFYNHFSHYLQTSFALNQKVILVIDECQRLSSHLLEEIIKLANIENNVEKDGTKLLKVLLIGQNEFDMVLRKNTSRELHQLIAGNYAIAPLDVHETGELIRHRLKIAGANRDIFSPDAIRTVYELSNGIPLRINIICDHALLLGYGQGSKTINDKLIRQCAEDLRPHDFFHPLPNLAVKTREDNAPLKIGNKPASPLPTASGNRRGKTIGIVIFVMLPIFLIAFLTNPAKLVKIATSTKPAREEAPARKEQDVTLEKEVPPSVIIPKEKKITAPTESANSPVLEEPPRASKELPDQQKAVKEDPPTDQKSIQETPNDLPEDLSKPTEAAATEDLSPPIREDTDPGAIIDYILKQRPK